MARRHSGEAEGGVDSFLDVITNIVGILIILVMVVAERARTAPLPAPTGPCKELVEAAAHSTKLENDIHEMTRQMATVQAETQAKAHERGQLSVVIAAIEQEMEKRKLQLDAAAQGRYETDRELALARDELTRLEAQQGLAEQAAAPKTVKIENYPTPLGKTVDGDEAHIQLSRGRLAIVPFDLLMSQMRGELRSKAMEMQNQSELVDTVGPVEGFRARYVLQRHDTNQGSLFQLAYVEFLPTSGQLGETVEDAMAPNSRFRAALARLSPQRYTITIWTYPDSFEDYGKLKKVLYEAGYSVAARPLPEGAPIGAAPHGSKSSAQ
jgi:hypothetical protein